MTKRKFFSSIVRDSLSAQTGIFRKVLYEWVIFDFIEKVLENTRNKDIITLLTWNEGRMALPFFIIFMNRKQRIEIILTFDAVVREFPSDLGDNASAKISQTTGIRVQSETIVTMTQY